MLLADSLPGKVSFYFLLLLPTAGSSLRAHLKRQLPREIARFCLPIPVPSYLQLPVLSLCCPFLPVGHESHEDRGMPLCFMSSTQSIPSVQ